MKTHEIKVLLKTNSSFFQNIEKAYEEKCSVALKLCEVSKRELKKFKTHSLS